MSQTKNFNELGEKPVGSLLMQYAIPAIIAKRLPKVPFRILRIAYDGVATFIGFLFGGVPGVVTIIMVFALGPVIAWVGKKIRKKWDFLDEEMTK